MEFASEHSKYNRNAGDQSTHTGLYGQARVSFVRKVYSLLSVQLAFTVISVYLAIYSSAFFNFVRNNTWLMIASLVVCLASQLFVFLSKTGRSYPYNLSALALFTLGETYSVAAICNRLCWEVLPRSSTLVFLPSEARLVGTAALLTVGLVGSITLYAFYTKKDFTLGSSLISMLASTFSMIMLVYMFSNNSLLATVYLYLGLVMFGVYLLIDTQRIVGGKRLQLKVDEYATGAMLLYADIVVLFLKLLSILQKMQKKERD